jgi:hypothetical protein
MLKNKCRKKNVEEKNAEEKNVDGKYAERVDNSVFDRNGENDILFYLTKRKIDVLLMKVKMSVRCEGEGGA